MDSIKDIRFHRIVRPLRTTFSTALGQKRQIQNVLVTVTLHDGTTGAGEIPTSIAFSAETVDVIVRTLTEAVQILKGKTVADYGAYIEELRDRFPHARMTVSGLEVALFRACLALQGTSEITYWGNKETHVATDITVPFVADTALLTRWLSRAVKKGFTAYKLKVGGEPEADRKLLSWLHDRLKAEVPDFRLRLDGNQGFTAASFMAFMDCIGTMGHAIELFEQPLRADDLRGLAAIQPRSPVPIILDESIRTVQDAARAADNGLCHGVNVKIAKSGIRESAALVNLAKKHGLKLMIGCMMESMVGLSAAVYMAAGTGSFDFIDLDSVHFLYGPQRFGLLRSEGPMFLLE